MVDLDPSGARDRESPVMIGRAEALDHAMRRWNSARQGTGHLLLIAGEAGIGKTRLLAEFAQRVGEPPMPRVAAYPRETDSPGAVLHTLADELRRLGLLEPARRLRDRLADESEIGDDSRRRRLVLGDLAEIITTLLADRPMLLRIEDLHWSDQLSLDVLERVAATLRDSPSLIVATYRPEEAQGETPLRQWRARLVEQRLAEEVRLPRLDREQTAQIVEVITGAIPSVELVESLFRRSDGIPLHIEELAALDPQSPVLETVADAVQASVARLSPVTREVVEAAAVIGRAFDVTLLEQITRVSADTVETALAEASAGHVVVRSPDGTGYGFRHSIVCDVVYNAIPAHRRAAIHGAVAQAAILDGRSDAYISEHFERAGEQSLAHVHAQRAADDAVRVSAHREAAELMRRALRTSPAESDPRSLAALNYRLAAELAAIDDNEGAATALELAIEFYRDLGDETAAAELIPALMSSRHLLGGDLPTRTALAVDAISRLHASGGHPELIRARLLGALSAAYMLDRRLEESMDYGQQAAAVAHLVDVDLTLGSVLVFAGRGDEGWPLLEGVVNGAADGLEADIARGYRMLGSCASVLVEYDRATTFISAGIDYTARTERWNDHHYLVAHLAHVRWATGDWAEADRHARRALADGRGITTRITGLIVLGYLALGRGEWNAARESLSEARMLGERMNELQRISPALWGLAELALAEGEGTLAMATCELAFAESARVRDAAYLFPFVLTGTRAYLVRRDRRGASDWLARCRVLLEARGIPGTLPALDHAEGLVELAEGRTGAARALLERALSGWEEHDRQWETLQALRDLAQCARRSRRPADAVRLEAQAAILAKRMGAVSERDDPADDPGPLSARELEVARLVAAGATNREIAASLVISPKTVSSHIEHILAKLAVARRSGIAAWVAAAEAGAAQPH